MERDDLIEAWASLEAHLKRTQKLNDAFVAQSMTNRAQTALARERRWLVVEIVVNYVAIIALGSFAASHYAQAAAFVSTCVLDAALIAINVVLINIATAIGRLDYEEPIVAIQSTLERIKMRRVWLTGAIFATGPLLWTALTIVMLAAAGVDAIGTLGIAYVAANVLFGIVVCAAAWAFARTIGPRVARTGWARTLVDALSGSEYRRAADVLDTIERFQEA